MVTRIHHINFLVRDLAQAVPRFKMLFGSPAAEAESLPERGVEVVRFRVGDTWVILVQPTDPAGEPARVLNERGEGFFLASFEVDDLEKAATELGGKGLCPPLSQSRKGLEDWRVLDLDAAQFNGVQFQLVKSSGEAEQI